MNHQSSIPSNAIVLSDPVHGFIRVSKNIIQPLLESREMQRLRRIKQLGMGLIVYPAAEHSRFAHALGAMAFLSQALDSLEAKEVCIQSDERTAAMAAILLHDIGHTPYSHTLEYELVRNTRHEHISVALIKSLKLKDRSSFDEDMRKMILQMLSGTYERQFFCDLIAGQLDMDRMDYLCRDSHFTGVVEGKIGSGRILQTLCVHPIEEGGNSRLAVESKGIYAVENMLLARRLMYWQVYLHKTVLAADVVLKGAIKRARDLIHDNDEQKVEGISSTLKWFLQQHLDEQQLKSEEFREKFLDLDDSDITHSLKQWCKSPDKILSDLSRRIIHRDLFRCTFLQEHPSDAILQSWQEQVTSYLIKNGISTPNAHQYYLSTGRAQHLAYKMKEDEKAEIHVFDPKDENLKKLGDYLGKETMNILTKYEKKPYLCHPKEVVLHS